jgi:hypothetical protein
MHEERRTMATAKKGRVKNQHFVPKVLLRGFSPEKKTTSVFVIGSATFIETASIKTQCSQDYFYGHEQKVEDDLQNLETAFGKVLKDLSPEKIEGFTEAELSVIRAFVHQQAERTPFAAGVMRTSYVDIGRQLGAAFAKANGFGVEGVEEEAEGFARHHMPNPAAHTVELAQKHGGVIKDLAVKFVTGKGFMISDHPALMLNIWRDHHPKFNAWPSIGGLASKGLILVLPVATNTLLIVYDAATYRVGHDGSRTAYANDDDVMVLNALQTINATKLLFDSSVVKPIDVIGPLVIRNQVREEQGPGPLPLRPTGIQLTFLEVTDRDTYDDYNLMMLPVRDPTVLETLNAGGPPPL